MAYRADLRWFPLAIVERPAEPVGGLAAHHVHRVPEDGCVALVRDIAQHAGDFSVAHLMVRLPGELKVITLVVDRPRAAIPDDDAPIGRRNDVVDRDIAFTW